MKNSFFNYKFLVAHKASNYPVIYSKISYYLTGKKWYVNNDTNIVIDGFPRCANTYATYAFILAQPKELKIAHHIHKKSQFLVARKLKIPSILLIRNPVDCIGSLLIRQPKYDAAALFKGYYYLYNGLKNLDTFIVANFEDTLEDYGKIIKKVNQKFDSNFELYIKNSSNEKKLKEIIYNQDELFNSNNTLSKVAYPNEEKKVLINSAKESLLDKKYEELIKKCTDIFNFLINK